MAFTRRRSCGAGPKRPAALVVKAISCRSSSSPTPEVTGPPPSGLSMPSTIAPGARLLRLAHSTQPFLPFPCSSEPLNPDARCDLSHRAMSRCTKTRRNDREQWEQHRENRARSHTFRHQSEGNENPSPELDRSNPLLQERGVMQFLCQPNARRSSGFPDCPQALLRSAIRAQRGAGKAGSLAVRGGKRWGRRCVHAT